MTRVLVAGKIKRGKIKDGVRWSFLNLFPTSWHEPGWRSRTPVSNRRLAQQWLLGCPTTPAACVPRARRH